MGQLINGHHSSSHFPTVGRRGLGGEGLLLGERMGKGKVNFTLRGKANMAKLTLRSVFCRYFYVTRNMQMEVT